MQEKLKIAIQKSGRLSEKSISLLNECGIRFYVSKTKLRTEAHNFPVEILFLRDDDIPEYVQDGVADIGILGENGVLEKAKNINVIQPLGFAKCRLSIAVPKSSDYQLLTDLAGKRIATSYPVILKNFLNKNQIKADIHFISGSVEVAPSIGLADAVCDIVSSGSTLLANGLKEVHVILNSQAVLVANPNLSGSKQAIFDNLLFRIHSVLASKNHKYILLNAPKDKLDTILNVLPGLKSPTVTPLADPRWVSVHTVIQEDEFWDKIELLRDAGAEGILVIPIEKMIV